MSAIYYGNVDITIHQSYKRYNLVNPKLGKLTVDHKIKVLGKTSDHFIIAAY